MRSTKRDTRRPAVPDARPLPWGDEPDLHVPELAGIGMEWIPMSELSRHMLITGETGSGKTASAIGPVLRALLAYPGVGTMSTARARQLRPSILIMDPKHELAGDVVRTNTRLRLRRRIVQFTKGDGRVVHLFEGLDTLAMGVDEQLARILRLCPAYHEERSKTNAAFFVLQATLALRALLGADQVVVRSLGVDALPRFWASVRTHLSMRLGSVPDGLQYERVAYLRPHTALISLMASHCSAVVHAYAQACSDHGVPRSLLLPIMAWTMNRDETVAAIVSTAHSFLTDLSGALADRVSFNPYEAPPEDQWFSVRRALDEGVVLVLSPNELDPIDVAATVTVKSLYFTHAFTRTRKERPFVYVADEAQVVLTMDASAEHRFLDRCRAFRCAAVLATQGIGSLRMRLNTLAGPMLAQPALDILLINTGTKLWFRSTDVATREALRGLVPEPELRHKPHVVEICPPSALRVGECYALGPGGWGRGKVEIGGPEGQPVARESSSASPAT